MNLYFYYGRFVVVYTSPKGYVCIKHVLVKYENNTLLIQI